MKKGFTLIELLAVIVILAIIALIATPIVLSIISDSKESSQIRSAEMYLKGVETSVATATLNEKNITDGTYPIMSNGNVCLGTITDNKCKEEETLVVEMNGETPTSGSVTIESGKVKEITFTYSSGKTIVKNNEGNLVYGEQEENTSGTNEKTLSTLCTQDTTNGVAEKTAGAKYTCEVKEGTSYNFYVLTTPAEGDTTINLIMDRNICEDGTPTEEGKTCLVAWQTSGKNADGPVTAMNYLYNATKDWTNIPNIEMNYTDEGNTGSNGYGTIITTDNITKITRKKGTAVTVLTDQEGYSDLKARLPYKSEVSDCDFGNKTNAYLYDYLQSASNIQTNAISGILGYWTLSSYVATYNYAWRVFYVGNVRDNGTVNDDSYYGVRAVITLKI